MFEEGVLGLSIDGGDDGLVRVLIWSGAAQSEQRIWQGVACEVDSFLLRNDHPVRGKSVVEHAEGD